MVVVEDTEIGDEYNVEDAREFLTEQGVDVDAIAPQVDGKFMSAFVRATKPASLAVDITGGGAAAERVEPVPPETGVCNRSAAPEANGCCGGPAISVVDACCTADANAKQAGKSGCGCAS